MSPQQRAEFVEALLAQVHELLDLHEQGIRRDLHICFGRVSPAHRDVPPPQVQLTAYDLKK